MAEEKENARFGEVQRLLIDILGANIFLSQSFGKMFFFSGREGRNGKKWEAFTAKFTGVALSSGNITESLVDCDIYLWIFAETPEGKIRLKVFLSKEREKLVWSLSGNNRDVAFEEATFRFI